VQEAACEVKHFPSLRKKILTGGIEDPVYMLNGIEMKCKKDHREW